MAKNHKCSNTFFRRGRKSLTIQLLRGVNCLVCQGIWKEYFLLAAVPMVAVCQVSNQLCRKAVVNFIPDGTSGLSQRNRCADDGGRTALENASPAGSGVRSSRHSRARLQLAPSPSTALRAGSTGTRSFVLPTRHSRAGLLIVPSPTGLVLVSGFGFAAMAESSKVIFISFGGPLSTPASEIHASSITTQTRLSSRSCDGVVSGSQRTVPRLAPETG
jgi:hypothetical protein